MKKKKYRIRQGSLAWVMVRIWRPVTLLLFVTLIMSLYTVAAKCTEQSTGKEKGSSKIEYGNEVIPEETKEYRWDVPLEYELQRYIEVLCEEKHVPPQIVFAVIAVESNYNAAALGDGGESIGLMQIQPKWLDKKVDLLNPYNNVAVGISILSEKLSKYGIIEKALVAYNAGDQGAKQYFEKGIISNEYSRKVIAKADSIEQIVMN